MKLKLGIVKETLYAEQRVALVPALVKQYANLGMEILLETGAGAAAYFADAAYGDVQLIHDRNIIWRTADLILKVHAPTIEELAEAKKGGVIAGLLAPQRHPHTIQLMCDRNITSFALELLPRISRAQAMDVLSSQAGVAGYRAVLLAASLSGRFFPMLTTAAGTIRPVSVLVIGAGVAGLQAIATAKRLGAIVEAYDIRPVSREQVESLGAKFVQLDVDAASAGGYARELSAEEQAQQQQVLLQHVAKAEVIICTAAIPGRQAPQIISDAMVAAMRPGAVIVDLAAESGGNCALTQAGETLHHNGVIIAGPVNVPSQLPIDASEMYARNLFNFTKLLVNANGEMNFDWQDPLLAETVITHAGEVKHPVARKLVEPQL